MRFILVLLSFLQSFTTSSSDRPEGWAKYFEENPTEFHDLPLTWENGATAIPDWLGGTFVRNGPAQLNFGTNKHKLGSWLDGYAKLHSFKFNGKNSVLFSGKMLESTTYQGNLAAGEIIPQLTIARFLEGSEEWSWMELMQIVWKMTFGTALDNTNPGLWRLGSPEHPMYVATTDSPILTQFDISTLDTLELVKADQAVSSCTHWMREPGTDNSINFMVKIGWRGPYVEILRYRPENHDYNKPELISTFKTTRVSMIHSFSITENHLVMFFYPFTVDPSKFLEVNFHLMEAAKWNEHEQTDIYIIHLKTGQVQSIPAKTLYSYHHINAYEINNGTEIVLDMSPSDPFNLVNYTSLDNMLNPPEVPTGINGSTCGPNEVTRYVINLGANYVETSTFVNVIQSDYINRFDFPTINENYRGRKYCIVYGVSAFDYFRTALVKKNVCDSTLDKIWHMNNHYVSEMYFIPDPEDTAEDSGVLVSIVFDGVPERSYLLMLDASTFTQLDRAYLPHNIPWSAHGIHFPEAQYNTQLQFRAGSS